MLLATVSGCQTTTPSSAISDASFCDAARAIYYSRHDTAPTIAQIREHNAVGLALNAICAALPSVCSALLAHAIVGGPGAGVAAAVNWFQTLTSGRLIAIDAWRKVQDGSSTRLEDGVAAALGLAARVDFQHGGYPFWSISGQQVNGTIGLKNYYPFSLLDGATVGQELLALHIGTIARGEAGVDTAIASNGFVFAGVWNADNDPL